ncbi:response regulator [Haloarchaeobius sp. HRN-SO-5]|uniref:response regulator n=1 Tax=Haloarchaeobius sp. HRN-SO-5 TaxID=3446118 RepID=UPI003EB712D8
MSDSTGGDGGRDRRQNDEGARRRPISVLLVDDSPDLADSVAAVLQRDNDDLTVATTTDPIDAFSVLGEGTVDCVVSDYRMQPIDGMEFLDVVRESYPGMPFVMLTNKGSDVVEADALAAGAAAYLEKEADPAQYGRLAETIRAAIRPGSGDA